MADGQLEVGSDRQVGPAEAVGTILLALFAGYLLVVSTANWAYFTYKGTQAPESYGEPVANAIVGLLPLVLVGVVGWLSRRRGSGAWKVTRALALAAIPASLIALALGSGPWI